MKTCIAILIALCVQTNTTLIAPDFEPSSTPDTPLLAPDFEPSSMPLIAPDFEPSATPNTPSLAPDFEPGASDIPFDHTTSIRL